MNYDIQIIPFNENSVILLTVDFGDVPKGKYEEKLAEFKETFKEEIDKLKVGGRDVIIMPKNISVSSIPLNEGDIISVQVDCGYMPPKRALEYVEEVKKSFKNVFDNKVIVSANRPDRTAIAVSVEKE